MALRYAACFAATCCLFLTLAFHHRVLPTATRFFGVHQAAAGTKVGSAETLQTCVERAVDQTSASIKTTSLPLKWDATNNNNSATLLHNVSAWFPTNHHNFSDVLETMFAPWFKHPSRKKDSINLGSYMPMDLIMIEIVSGKLSFRLSKIQNTDRAESVLDLLVRLLAAHKDVPDVTFFVCLADLPPWKEEGRLNPNFKPPIPLFMFDKMAGDPSGLLFPCFSFGLPKGQGDLKPVLDAGAAILWSSREEHLFFRGTRNTYRRASWEQYRGLKLEGQPGLDVGTLTAPEQVFPHTSREGHCRYKYLLHQHGGWPAWSFRLKFLLACGSAVVIPQADWYEYWYSLLKPWVHFVPAGNSLLTGSNDMPLIAACLRKHDAEAAAIGRRGAEFVRRYLTDDGVLSYLKSLLKKYKEVFRAE